MAIQWNPACPGRLKTAKAGLAIFRRDILAGLRQAPKRIPCKYFYDAAGSQLFDAICRTPEYYPTRAELNIMRTSSEEMAVLLGRGCQVIEFGSGSSVKTRWLLRYLPRPVAYAPVDISAEHLHRSAASLAVQFPEVEVRPVAADFSEPFDLPDCSIEVHRRVVYFPGSTIGNFEPSAARHLLQRIGECCGKTGALLIGVDLKKDPARLNAAYNDTAGLTSAFNLNLLARINRELEANFDLAAFAHRAEYYANLGRVEMHLVSRRKQFVRIAGELISFQEGESIHTENSYKYTISEFRGLSDQAGFRFVQVWMDPESLFSVHLYERTE